MKIKLATLMVALCAVLTACNGNKRLEAGGAYNQITPPSPGQTNVITNPDYAFFTVDLTFKTLYSSLDAAFKFERDNREALWKIDHGIKHGMDKLRTQATKVVIAYAAVRTQYLQNPTPSNLDAFNTVIADLQKIVATSASIVNQFYKP